VNGDDIDIHLTRLGGWAMQTVGSAVLVAAFVNVVFSLLALFSEDNGWVWTGLLLSAIAFGLRLYVARPPVPHRIRSASRARSNADQ
jgi:hypothetical protein